MDPSQLQPGTRLDRYELLCPLAYGGMASVWLARFGGRLGFERLVVIKMILPQFSQEPRFQQMFLDEARIASKIEHSNVARILDVGEYHDNYYLVMEWVDGDSLSKLMRASEQRKERIPAGVALRIAADAAAGLNSAHELKERDGTHLQVVHRDVSPQNILIANNGTTVLIDFGVAKARDRASENTNAGQLKGKIRYMAPEQARGADIDHRADLWAVGAFLYEMFSGGVPPYEGPNEVATLHALTSGAAPKPLPASTPSAVAKIVERALAHAAEDRYQTALDMNQALEAAMVELNQPTTPASVARYAAELLAERKAARKRAVDKALEAARKRDVPKPPHRSTSAPLPKTDDAEDNPSGETVALPMSSPAAPAARVAPSAPMAQSGAYFPSAPSAPSASASAYRMAFGSNDAHGQRGLGEHPSVASNGTIGSAAMEYPKQPPPLVGGDRRRRYLIAAAIGLSLAVGPIVAVGFVSVALRRDDGKARAAAAESAATTAPAATTVIEFAPPAPAPPSPTEAAPEAADEPPATSAAPLASTAAAPASAPLAAAPTTPPPAKPTAAAATHRPVAAPTPKPRGNSVPRPDRGF